MTEVKGKEKENEIVVEKKDMEALYKYAASKRTNSGEPLYDFLETYSPEFTTMSGRFGQGCMRSYDKFDPKTTGRFGEWIVADYAAFKRNYKNEENARYCSCCGQLNPGEYLSDIMPLPEGEGDGFYYIAEKNGMSDIIIFRDYKKANSDKEGAKNEK